MIFLFVVDTCQDEENLQALKVCPDTHSLAHSHTSLSLSLSLWLAGISPVVSESHPTYCSCGPHHLWQDGLYTYIGFDPHSIPSSYSLFSMPSLFWVLHVLKHFTPSSLLPSHFLHPSLFSLPFFLPLLPPSLSLPRSSSMNWGVMVMPRAMCSEAVRMSM